MNGEDRVTVDNENIHDNDMLGDKHHIIMNSHISSETGCGLNSATKWTSISGVNTLREPWARKGEEPERIRARVATVSAKYLRGTSAANYASKDT